MAKAGKEQPTIRRRKSFLAEALVDGYNDAGEPRTGQKEALTILQSVLKHEPRTRRNHY